MIKIQSLGGKARAARAARGDSGQFLPARQPAANPAARNPAGGQDPSSSNSLRRDGVRTKPLTLKTLHLETEWWEALAAQYPNVNLERELLKAMDWHRADRVKSPKLYFRNWVEKASSWAEPIELTADQIRARMRIVS